MGLDNYIVSQIEAERENYRYMVKCIGNIFEDEDIETQMECYDLLRKYEEDLHKTKMQLHDLKKTYATKTIPDIKKNLGTYTSYNSTSNKKKIISIINQYYALMLNHFRQEVLKEKILEEIEEEGEEIELE